MKNLKMLPPSHLDQLLRASKPIYVINSSSLPDGHKGTIVVNFFDGTRKDFFKMPPTYIPMALSDAIPPKLIGDSRDFRKCLTKGVLTLVDPLSAEDFLTSQDARDEYEALLLSEHSAKAKNINWNAGTRTKVSHQNNEGAGPVQDVSAVDTISNKVRGLVEGMIEGTNKPEEVLIQLRRHQSALHAVDFSYVLANADDEKLVTWTKRALSTATGKDFDLADVKPTKKLKKKVTKVKDEFAFKTSKDDEDNMTPEEKQKDAIARQNAMSSQAVNASSRYQDEVNKIMQGSI